MSNLSVLVAGVIAVIVAFFVISKITGFIFRLIILAVLVAFLYYLYQAGLHEIIMAPGVPRDEVVASII